MIKITKNNLDKFNEYYHSFHDSYITNINYDIIESKIELFINVCWSGEPNKKNNGTYETNKTKINIIFNNIKQFSNKEIFSWDYINAAFIQYIILDEKEYICFADDKREPLIYIVCESIEYNEIGGKW